MGHAITVGGLLLTLGIIGGLVGACIGIVDAFGNMMADAAGDNGKQGCIIFAISAAVLIGCILKAVL